MNLKGKRGKTSKGSRRKDSALEREEKKKVAFGKDLLQILSTVKIFLKFHVISGKSRGSLEFSRKDVIECLDF